MNTIEVKTPDDLIMIEKVAMVQLELHGHLDVIIKKHDGSVKTEQRGLYWRWMPYICAHTGYTEQEQHNVFKWKYLVGIFQRDTDRHPDFKDVSALCKTISREKPELFPSVKAHILRSCSHLDASAKEMQQYLKEVNNEANDLGVRLPASTRKGVQ